MFLQLCLFSLLAFVAAVPTPDESSVYIPGGHDVKIEDVPYQVSLHALGKSHCGGAILSKSWVITAAKCTSYAPNVMTVRAGSTKHSSGGTIHSVDEIIRYPNYTINNHGVPINDVAVLKLRPPIDLNGIPKAIQISKDVVRSGVRTTITGWGATDESGTQWNTLRRLYLNSITKESCDEAYEELVKLPEAKICVEAPGGKGVCNGDEGGPVTVDDQLAGLVSWHYGCGEKGYPDVHTELYPVRDWVMSTTQISG
ncbi:trypsin-1-like [Andrena cerasifolii]|uniref:trypsin-1-like n=1 Tax=Andrena cerasifolii TaxID=2819439 RepID=UPI004037EE65